MTKSRKEEAAGLVSKTADVQLDGEYSLCPWGRADYHASLGGNRLLILEVEAEQKHPCTNVSKLWPYLEEHAEESALLVQVYFPDSPARGGSRDRLACWLAERMECCLGPRFQYCRVVLDPEHGSFVEGREQLERAIAATESCRERA